VCCVVCINSKIRHAPITRKGLVCMPYCCGVACNHARARTCICLTMLAHTHTDTLCYATLYLLQTQLQETQRLKQVVDIECQKAAAAAMHAKTLEAQLAASTAAVQEAQRAQFQLQQQVTFVGACSRCCIEGDTPHTVELVCR
jgi:hypothetical protein